MAFQVEKLTPAAQEKVFARSPELRAARDANAAKAAPAKTSAPAAAPAPRPIQMPDLSVPSIPGANTGEKALLVVGILIIGLGIYSRITGKSLNLGLVGFTGSAPAGKGSQQPAPTVASLPLTPTIAARTAAVNPTKVGA